MRKIIFEYLISSQFKELDKLINFYQKDEIIEFYNNNAHEYIAVSLSINNPNIFRYLI